MFELSRTIARNASLDLDGTAKVKFSMAALGHYDDSETGLSSYADDKLFTAINDFQKDNNLKVDGVIKPNGETQKAIKDALKKRPKAKNAFSAFLGNYWDMREANTIGADKYFHCRANYEATENGWGGFSVAKVLGDTREAVDLMTDSFKTGIGSTLKDIGEDQQANLHGRTAARSGKFESSRQACSKFRPKALDDKY